MIVRMRQGRQLVGSQTDVTARLPHPGVLAKRFTLIRGPSPQWMLIGSPAVAPRRSAPGEWCAGRPGTETSSQILQKAQKWKVPALKWFCFVFTQAYAVRRLNSQPQTT